MPSKPVGEVLNKHSNNTWNNWVCNSVRERALEAQERDPAAAARMAEAVWDATTKVLLRSVATAFAWANTMTTALGVG